MSLLGVELRRLLARRAVVVLLVASVLGSVAVTSVALWDYQPVPQAELERAERLAEEDAERPGVQRRLDRCLDRADTEQQQRRCERALPRAEWYLDQSPLRPRQLFEDLSVGLVLLLGFVGVLVGTTFVGAEFSSGSIAPLLLVRPRRTSVWAAKIAASGIGVGAVAVLAWGLSVGLVLVAGYGWAAADPGGNVVAGLLLQALRGAIVTGAAGVLGAAVTAAARSTAAGLGTVVGYVVVAEVVGRLAVAGAVERALLSNHLFGTVLGHWVVRDYSSCETGRGNLCPRVYEFDLADSGLALAAVVCVVLAVSLVTFRRRDVA